MKLNERLKKLERGRAERTAEPGIRNWVELVEAATGKEPQPAGRADQGVPVDWSALLQTARETEGKEI